MDLRIQLTQYWFVVWKKNHIRKRAFAWGCTHGEKSGEEFGSEQWVISSPEFGGTGHESLVVDPQLLGDFRARHHFLESLIPFWVRSLRAEVSFDLGRREGSEDESYDLAFDEVKVDRCRETQMALLGQVQELYIDLGNGNAVGYALREIPEIEGEVLGDEESFVVRWGVIKITGNGTVWKDVCVVFITSIVECGCDLDSEGEDTSDYLNRRDRDREGGSAGCGVEMN